MSVTNNWLRSNDFLAPLMALIFSLGLIITTLVMGPSGQQNKIKNLIAPPPMLEHFHFGFNEPLADSLWIRSIQDFDYCEDQLAKNLCRGNGWLYKMLDTVTTLSPHFRMPYATGPMALSVIISDIEGASKLFDKAVIAFPNDWPILYRAGYHAMAEEKNNQKAAELLIRAAKNGGGEWFNSLAARLLVNAGKKDLAMRLYEDLKQQGYEEGTLKRIKERLDGVEDLVEKNRKEKEATALKENQEIQDTPEAK